jgi:hypothetical protein
MGANGAETHGQSRGTVSWGTDEPRLVGQDWWAKTDWQSPPAARVAPVCGGPIGARGCGAVRSAPMHWKRPSPGRVQDGHRPQPKPTSRQAAAVQQPGLRLLRQSSSHTGPHRSPAAILVRTAVQQPAPVAPLPTAPRVPSPARVALRRGAPSSAVKHQPRRSSHAPAAGRPVPLDGPHGSQAGCRCGAPGPIRAECSWVPARGRDSWGGTGPAVPVRSHLGPHARLAVRADASPAQ